MIKAKLLVLPAILAAALGVSSNASAQDYRNDDGEEVVVQLLQSILGTRYESDRRYRGYTSQQQQAFRQADTNRDGVLTQREIDAYRSSYYRDRDRYDNRYDYDRRGVRVRDVDTNRDGWISRSEQDRFLRMINRR
jgi:hypothetical protein